jgi:ATP-dependent Lhr-like helicase
MARKSAALAEFHPAVQQWFDAAFESPTRPQRLGWPAIARGESTLILAPTGSGKTLTAFSVVSEPAAVRAGDRTRSRAAVCSTCRRSRRSPWTSSATCGRRSSASRMSPRRRARRWPNRPLPFAPATRPPRARRFQRAPADILITTPESLFLLLTSRARERLVSVDTVIIDEIHALVPG